MFLDLVKIGFPKYCISCNNSLLANETYLCVNCFFYIPKGELKIAKNTETGKLFENSETLKVVVIYSILIKMEKLKKYCMNSNTAITKNLENILENY